MSFYILLFLLGIALGALAAFVLLTRKHAIYVLDYEKQNLVLQGQIESLKKQDELKEMLYREKFETFAHEFLKKGTQSLQESSIKSFESVLKPLNEKIK